MDSVLEATGAATSIQRGPHFTETGRSVRWQDSHLAYDALNHLTNVSMPRRMPSGSVVTQTRTFNYISNNSISAYLQSATNPENGTVSYTYNADGTMATKLDAKGQTLKYAYDSYGRVLTVSLGGSPDTVLRTYTYDTNSADSSYSQYASGRLTTVQYSVPSISTVTNRFGQQVNFVGDTVTEMYSYTQPGQVAGKRLRVARQPFSGQALIADLNATWDYTSKNEGHLMGVTYPGDPNGIPTAPSYTYTYDAMGRLNTMTDGNGGTVVGGATYNAAGQMTSGVDTRTYNSMGQLTGVYIRRLAEHHLHLFRDPEQRQDNVPNRQSQRRASDLRLRLAQSPDLGRSGQHLGARLQLRSLRKPDGEDRAGGLGSDHGPDRPTLRQTASAPPTPTGTRPRVGCSTIPKTG